MTKYYRVRSQEQWEWLVNRFGQSETQWPEQGMSFEEIRECLASGGFVIVHNDYFPGVGSVSYTATPQNNGNVIEVSDLMEDEKMEDYVTINSEALKQIRWGTNYGKFGFIDHGEDGENHVYEQYLPANLEIPKFLVYPKVPMTEAEKKEFDLIHEEETLYNALDVIEYYPHLYKRIYEHTPASIPEFELEFARAWADPSLIEVIPEKRWNVKVPPFEKTNKYYYKFGGKLRWAYGIGNDYEDQQFTESELKEYGLDDDMFEKVEVKG